MSRHPGMVAVLLAALALVASGASAAVSPGGSARPYVITAQPPPVNRAGVTSELSCPDARSRTAALSAGDAWRSFVGQGAAGWAAQWNTVTGSPRFATGPALALPGFGRLTRENIKEACASFIARNAQLLRVDPSRLRLVSAANAGGRWYATYQQIAGGVPVVGAFVRMSFTRDDRLIAFGSDAYPGLTVDTVPKIDAKQALRVAMEDCNADPSRDRISAPDLRILPLPRGGGFDFALCWKLDIYQPAAHRRWQYYVSGVDGSIVNRRDVLWYDGISGTVRGEYKPEFEGDDVQLDLMRYCNVSAEGPETVIRAWDFDTDPGWTLTGKWQYGKPTGGGSNGRDPTSGYTGTNVIGYNLAGNYADNIATTYYATTPAIDCTGRTNVRLRFYRWLGIEDAAWDEADIQVSSNGANWVDVWKHDGPAISDSAWSYMDYDISTVADNKPRVYLRFGLGPTDTSVTYPGWNIDDVRIVSVQGGIHTGRTLADGVYSLTSPWDPCIVTSKLEGLYCDINYGGGGDTWFTRQGVGPDTVLDWIWDQNVYTRIDEPSVYRHINYIHDYYKLLDPTFNGLDYPVPTAVAVPGLANAYWDGMGVTFGAGDGVYYGNFGLSCEIVYHEYTHGVTEKIYTNIDFPYWAEPGAMNEAWSDYFGCILSLSQGPNVGDGGVVIGQPRGFRTLANDYRRETDWYGEVHEDSQMFSGALWECRAVLGGEIMDPIVHYARYAHAATFEDELLAILIEDDTRYGDNDLTNGTPHGEVIYSAFARHGIGGIRYMTASLAIDDSKGNGNGKFDPGENVQLEVALVNGWANATGIRATLACNDPYVIITRAGAEFPNAKHGEVVTNGADRFALKISPDCPETHTVDFTMSITADGPYAYERASLLYSTVAVGQVAYDDGGPEYLTTVYPNDGLAVRLTPEFYPFFPTHVRIYPYDSRPVTLVFWDDNGPDGSPGTQLKTLSLTPPGASQWYDVDISALNLTVSSGSIYVGWIGTDAYYSNGLDMDPPDAGRCWYYQSWSKKWYLSDGNLMIRLRYVPGSTAGQAKSAPDGTVVNCTGRAVTAAFPGAFYIEEPDRSGGIRVEKPGHGLSVGMRVSVTGSVYTNPNGERSIAATKVMASGSARVDPLSVNNLAVGGGPFGAQEGTWSWRWVKRPGEEPRYELTQSPGLSNIGLLVKTWGRVTAWGRDWFYIDDGGRVDDGTGIFGLCVRAPDILPPPTGSLVAVTGISSCEYYEGKLMNLLLVRTPADIITLQPPPGPSGVSSADAAAPRTRAAAAARGRHR